MDILTVPSYMSITGLPRDLQKLILDYLMPQRMDIYNLFFDLDIFDAIIDYASPMCQICQLDFKTRSFMLRTHNKHYHSDEYRMCWYCTQLVRNDTYRHHLDKHAEHFNTIYADEPYNQAVISRQEAIILKEATHPSISI